MRRSRAIGPQKWRDPPPRTFPVVTGKREKGCFTMNESTGSTIGYVYVPFKSVGSDRAKRGCENHLFYLPTSQLLELDLPSIVSFPFLFFHSILDFRATETRLVIY